ncbi:MAG TPA: ABC transporter ATP-binding protein, partial [Candidatus Avimonas sp.]|nr:ABC transporter ATP-binding protein [Candidatus Avimonas sp.]
MFQIRWLWQNTDKKHRVMFIIAMVFSAVTSAALLINPFLTSILVDEVIVAKDTKLLLPVLSGILVVQVLRQGLRYAMVMMLESSSQKTVYNIRSKLFTNLQYQEIRFFDTHRTGDLMTRMTGDLEWCRHCMAFISYSVVDSLVMFVSTLIFFFFINWKLTLILAAVAPLLLKVTRDYSKIIRPQFIEMRERLSEMNTAAQENIAGNRVVKAFSREEYECGKFREKNRNFRDSNLHINKLWLKHFPVIEGLANFMTLATVFLGGFFIIQKQLTPGELTIFTSLSWALANPMRNLGTLINDIQRFFSCASKVIEIFYARPLITDREDAADHPEPKGHIEFKNVSFSFNNTKVLENISFEVKEGETLGIIGPTGSGKTTIVNLLARLYDVDSGEILLDGCNIRMWKLQQLRGAIGTATQDVFLFSDTVDGNIAFGNQGLTEEEVRDFARRAAADGFINKMPEGYETIIGERGVGLSGGQKQRIALARALATRPAVLVLDDTTSALDNETEKYIQQQLAELPFKCTRIIISQRVSSVKDADQIIVLENGRITEKGKHEDLIRRRGYYCETYALQNDLPVDFEAAKAG